MQMTARSTYSRQSEMSAHGIEHIDSARGLGSLRSTPMEEGHRTELRRTSRPETMMVVASLATLLLVSTDVSGTAMAQMSSTPPSPLPQTPDQMRDRAPIGHR